MALNTTQQIYESVKQCTKPLITLKKDHNTDIIASSLALALWLKKLDKPAEIVCDNFNAPENLGFLTSPSIIKNELTHLRKFVISLDISENKIDKFSYKTENKKLNIYLTPKTGSFSKEDVSCSNSNFKYDLIFTLNTPDLESLKNIYEKNPDFFFNTPIINVCNLPENEHFGELNLIKLKSTSISEILYDLFNEIDPTLIDETIATCLLTGMIDKTKSFRDEKVTPKSLNIASELVAQGAKRDKIIKNLYQTKSVGTLKLWGAVLNRLQTNQNQKIAWSSVTAEDFKQTNTSSKHLTEVIDELITSIPTIEMTAIFFQINENTIDCLIKTEKELNLLQNFAEFNPQGTKNLIRITVDTSELKLAQMQILEYLKNLI